MLNMIEISKEGFASHIRALTSANPDVAREVFAFDSEEPAKVF
jgi:hypothetical protein